MSATNTLPDAKAIREKLGLSQAQFAARFGLPLATLKNFDQGRRTPRGPTALLLWVIEAYPEEVAEVVEQRELAAMRKKLAASAKRAKGKPAL